MPLFSFKKKEDRLVDDIDLDAPPEPPRIGLKEETSAEEPIDEELMIPKRKPRKQEIRAAKREMAPLPAEEKLPELPPLPEEGLEQLPKLEEMPLPEVKKERKKFSFFRKKKAPEKLSLPTGEELPEFPTLPEEGEEFPEIPELPEIRGEEEVLKWEVPIPKLEEPIKERIKPAVKIKFITINDFRYIQDSINGIKSILRESDVFFDDIEDAESVRERRCLEWRNNLQDINRKILFIDKTLFEDTT